MNLMTAHMETLKNAPHATIAFLDDNGHAFRLTLTEGMLDALIARLTRIRAEAFAEELDPFTEEAA